MENLDIVYILKENMDPSELTYSLRSVEQNFPHRKVWFVCGQPKGLVPDGRIVHKQVGATKWERVRSSWMEICRNKDIADDFFLFNDDFFVLQPVTEFLNMSDGTIRRRVNELLERRGNSNYCRNLKESEGLLREAGFNTNSFALHVPFLVNKVKVLETLNTFDLPMFRNLYGNQHGVPFVYHPDVKIWEIDRVPSDDWDYVSTTEDTFRYGAVGQWIRKKYPTPSRFERGTPYADT